MYAEQIQIILENQNELRNYSLRLNLIEYSQINPTFTLAILKEPLVYLPLLNDAVQHVQQDLILEYPKRKYYLKKNLFVRLTLNSAFEEFHFTRVPKTQDKGRIITFRGTVIRTGMVKMLELEKQFKCLKCGEILKSSFDIYQYNIIPKPNCCGKIVEIHDLKETKDYQEIRIQEQVSRLDIGTIPRTITCILMDDLVDECKAGDDVTITSIVIERWKKIKDYERCELEITLYANNIRVNNSNATLGLTRELQEEFQNYWKEYKDTPFLARNKILASFCPQVYGLYIVKLAIMLVLVGGVGKQEGGLKIRGDSHILLVGDPGTGKSQFLRFASMVSSRSVFTTGIGSTSAGLTVTAVKDSGEWQLEAGALVLADKGVCCIDEFGTIREQDKTAIHEAMEQQSISVAKAGLVCKLNTRCSIIAATNPKGKYDTKQNVEINTAIASPLLSRFDIIMVLLDQQNDEWDETVSSFLLANEITEIKTTNSPLFSIQKLSSYIDYVRQKQPQLTKNATIVLKNYYQMQRQKDFRNQARTTIRLLESLIRLSQAHAKLLCQDKVLVRDAVVAISVIEASMQTSALNGLKSCFETFPDDPDQEHLKMENDILIRLNNLPDLNYDTGLNNLPDLNYSTDLGLTNDMQHNNLQLNNTHQTNQQINNGTQSNDVVINVQHTENTSSDIENANPQSSNANVQAHKLQFPKDNEELDLLIDDRVSEASDESAVSWEPTLPKETNKQTNTQSEINDKTELSWEEYQQSLNIDKVVQSSLLANQKPVEKITIPCKNLETIPNTLEKSNKNPATRDNEIEQSFSRNAKETIQQKSIANKSKESKMDQEEDLSWEEYIQKAVSNTFEESITELCTGKSGMLLDLPEDPFESDEEIDSIPCNILGSSIPQNQSLPQAENSEKKRKIVEDYDFESNDLFASQVSNFGLDKFKYNKKK
ncbi:DNA helicase mcm9 [Boothiomyces sp. JEL0866]|nr:DNA helicase mcm9 [Boothiomyces sp. JEL0866]